MFFSQIQIENHRIQLMSLRVVNVQICELSGIYSYVRGNIGTDVYPCKGTLTEKSGEWCSVITLV